jgi:uncharacterized membrane protein YfcA
MNMHGFFPYDFTLWQWLALYFCGICVGVSKTGVSGMTVVAIPILAFLFGARESTGIVVPMLCFADLLAVAYYRRGAEWKHILRLLPWAVAGLGLALAVDNVVPAEHFKFLIGLCVLGGLPVMVWNDLRTGKSPPPVVEKENEGGEARVVRFLARVLFGTAGGFSTMIGNAAGPIMSVYLLFMRLPKKSFVGAAAWFFMIINYIKIPIQVFVWHNVTFAGLKVGLVLIPAVILGAFLGIMLVKKTSEAHYRILMYTMTLVSTVLLLFR